MALPDSSQIASEPAERWLLDAIRSRAGDFAKQLRTLPTTSSGSTPVPGLDWTVADLAQHIACLPKFWRGISEQGEDYERPSDFAAFSKQARAHITEADPAALADLIESEFEGLVDELGDGNAPPRLLYGLPMTATHQGGLAISELVIHGQDLAAVSGVTPPSFTRAEANAAVDGLMATTPAFVDAEKARKLPDGIYHVAFKGGRDYTWTKSGPALAITDGRPAKADARMIADPAMFAMSSLGRVSDIRAGLSGKLISYGRKPWRFLGLGTVAVDGV